MGIRLIVEVLDHAPVELAPQERLLLVVLAETAADDTRMCWPGMETLTRRMGLSARRVREVLADLGQRGYEVRVPSGVDRHGMAVFASKGHRTVYRVPAFRQRGTDPAPFKAAGSRPPFPQEPSEEPSDLARARARELAAVIEALKDRTGKTIDEHHATLVIKQLVDGRTGVRDRIAYLTAVIAKDPDPGRFLPTYTPAPYQREQS